MTTQNTTQATATLPDPQAAFNHLFGNVHAQAFFGKLGQLGYTPTTEKEAQDLLELAGKLRITEAQTKTAATSPFAAASSHLDRALAAHGLDGGVKRASAQERDIAIGNVASQLMQDPAIYNSVLSVKAAEAEQVAQQLGLTQAQA